MCGQTSPSLTKCPKPYVVQAGDTCYDLAVANDFQGSGGSADTVSDGVSKCGLISSFVDTFCI
jgi:hypothetical protein